MNESYEMIKKSSSCHFFFSFPSKFLLTRYFFPHFQMSELPETIIVNKTPQNMSPEMASMLENFNKKTSLSSPTTVATSSPLITNGLSRQNLLNSSTNSTSSVSKSSQQVSFSSVRLKTFSDAHDGH